jgi:hypothetical protein
MRNCFRELLAAVAATLILAGPAQAMLQARDLDGDSVTDAFYDTGLNITWLRDANANRGNGSGGLMNWADGNAWASNYSIGAYDDWRMPTVVQPDSNCGESFDAGPGIGIQSYGFNCTGSEMAQLWYTQLGNTEGSMTRTGDFLNLQSDFYWSSTEYALNPDGAWVFGTYNGFQNVGGKTNQFYSIAVHDGNIGTPVPEPKSLLLALTALSFMALVRRRKQ